MAFTQLYSYFVLARKTNNLKIATIVRIEDRVMAMVFDATFNNM
jgi:hypothetical protein